jgi:hypothetical protein
MFIPLQIAYSCSAVLHKFDHSRFPIVSNGNCPRGISQILMQSHDMECDFVQYDHDSSRILKEHFLQIDREDNRWLTKMIHSISLVGALVSQTETAKLVLLVLKHVKLLVTEYWTSKPSARCATKVQTKASIVPVQLVPWQGIGHIRGQLKARDFLGKW